MESSVGSSTAVAAPVAVSSSAVATQTARWLGLDLLRFLAVFLMVQGHTFYVVLEPTVRAAGWYGYHNYVHGYTAPIFLFSSGMAFGITTFRRWHEHATWGKAVRKRIERYLTLLVIGYGLQFPGLSLKLLRNASPESYARAFRVDALHHIAVVLLVAELLVLLLKNQRRFTITAAVLGTTAVLSAPAIWRLPVDGLPAWLAAYVNASTASIFPIAPWAGFIFAGILAARVVWDPAQRSVRKGIVGPLFAVGIVLVISGQLLTKSGLNPFGEHNYWKTSPFFFLVRLGGVVVVLAALCAFANWLQAKHAAATRGVVFSKVQLMGQESLVIYVTHLLVLYGSAFNRGINANYSKAFTLTESILTFVAIFVGVALFAWAWSSARARWTKGFAVFRYGLLFGAIAWFFTH